MLVPFSALVPTENAVPYPELVAAARAMRDDPGSYQGRVGYRLAPPALYRWTITPPGGEAVVGVTGLMPLASLVPHEGTTPKGAVRPLRPIQIRPVMALTDESLPDAEPLSAPVVFEGNHRHEVVPISREEWPVGGVVIADGHHRVAAARFHAGDSLIMTMVVGRSRGHLNAGAFHRVFAESVRRPSSLEGLATVDETPEESLAAGRISVASAFGAMGLRLTPEGAAAVPRPLHGIPAGIAARLILPQLGLDEIHARYVDDVTTGLRFAQTGTALFLPSSDIDAVIEAGRSRIDLPPKSTRFRPKPVRGLLMRSL